MSSLVAPVKLGYAAAGTDDGHAASGGAEWAIGHPEKLIDFGYRAVHETSMQAKAIIQAFYGKELSRAYFVGCSDGGREALMEAQRYPEDFDGIVAGAPASNWSMLATGFVWNEQALLKDSPAPSRPPSFRLSRPPRWPPAMRSTASVTGWWKTRASADSIRRSWPASPATHPIACTAPQLDALRKIYAGPRNPAPGRRSSPATSPEPRPAPVAGRPGSRRRRRSAPFSSDSPTATTATGCFRATELGLPYTGFRR